MSNSQSQQPTIRASFFGGAAGRFDRNNRTCPGQGNETRQMVDVICEFARGTAVRGQSVESAGVIAALRNAQDNVGHRADSVFEKSDDLSYKRIPLKTLFSVQASYQFIGKLKPRQFPLDE